MSRAKEASGGDDRTMVLKFQSVGAKSTTEVLVKSFKPLAQGLETYGKEEGIQTSRLKLVFDGEVLFEGAVRTSRSSSAQFLVRAWEPVRLVAAELTGSF